jgi:glucokinase
MSDIILALDFGGTKHTAAIATPGSREWLARRQVFAPPRADADWDLATMLAMAHGLLAAQPGARLAAVGVSFGGPVEFSTGTVRLSHHVPGWENRRLRELLEKEFAVPAMVDNDANMAALGEHRFGAGQGCTSLLYITVSTGVGGGWILNGQPWRGHESMAGEFGHMRVEPEGPDCVCGGRGCVERIAAGPNIAHRAREWLASQPDGGHVLRRLCAGDLAAIDARMVARAAAEGDDLAWQALAVAARALGTAIGSAANLVNPQRFIAGGGVTKSGERFWKALRDAARSAAMPEVTFDIVPAALGDDAPLWGAVALASD